VAEEHATAPLVAEQPAGDVDGAVLEHEQVHGIA